MMHQSRRAARLLTVYGLLIGGSAIFILPFLWMAGTSVKVDREMFSENLRLFPMRPVPAQVSPYLDDKYFPPAPESKMVEEAVTANMPELPEHLQVEQDAAGILSDGIWQKLRQVIPERTWQNDPREAIQKEVTPELVAAQLEKVYRHFSLSAVRVRSHDLQEIEVTAGKPVSEFWNVTGGANLADGMEGKTPYADLVYNFKNNRNGMIQLSRTIDLPFAADRLFRTFISLRADDSWHRLEFFIEKNGRLLRGVRPEFLGNFQWSVITLQEKIEGEDDTSKIRLWIAMREIDRGPQYESRPDKMKLTVQMHRSSQAGAWWAKCQRNYRGALDYIPFWRYTATSVFLVVLNIIGNIFACSLVAYAFARLQWPGRGFCFGLMLATMMIPPQITMIPYFLIIKHLGWYNTLTPLWFVSFFGNAFNIFLLRQSMMGIPRDLEDSARIDGCNFLQIYWYVIMPLIKPTLACIAIFTFMGVWNDFMGPLIYLSDQRLYPLSLGLYALNVQAGGNFGMMMAGALLMTLPVVAIFFFAQKYFIQGVTLTGMKG
ncbi:MAG TPA: ABC transporter permease subunit [Kiritimatiellia bacterium]|nr:ABC transporter permease subunit [Kiritimatiellia bacterium]HQQ04831.1 ABC transporter permease subunit [Kiritimatiellia bacterium]